MATQNLKLSSITIDPKLQMRVEVSTETIEEYAVAMSLNAKFPPLRVVKVEDKYFLVDGFHRYKAAVKVRGKDEEVECEITEGAFSDAIKIAACANQINGLRRTNDDKRKAVKAILSLDEFKMTPNKKIAEIVGVSDKLVASIKEESSSKDSTMADRVETTRNGKPFLTKAKQNKKKKTAEAKSEDGHPKSEPNKEKAARIEAQEKVPSEPNDIPPNDDQILALSEKLLTLLNQRARGVPIIGNDNVRQTLKSLEMLTHDLLERHFTAFERKDQADTNTDPKAAA